MEDMTNDNNKNHEIRRVMVRGIPKDCVFKWFIQALYSSIREENVIRVFAWRGRNKKFTIGSARIDFKDADSAQQLLNQGLELEHLEKVVKLDCQPFKQPKRRRKPAQKREVACTNKDTSEGASSSQTSSLAPILGESSDEASTNKRKRDSKDNVPLPNQPEEKVQSPVIKKKKGAEAAANDNGEMEQDAPQDEPVTVTENKESQDDQGQHKLNLDDCKNILNTGMANFSYQILKKESDELKNQLEPEKSSKTSEEKQLASIKQETDPELDELKDQLKASRETTLALQAELVTEKTLTKKTQREKEELEEEVKRLKKLLVVVEFHTNSLQKMIRS